LENVVATRGPNIRLPETKTTRKNVQVTQLFAELFSLSNTTATAHRFFKAASYWHLTVILLWTDRGQEIGVVSSWHSRPPIRTLCWLFLFCLWICLYI